jgi:hypothetical protein
VRGNFKRLRELVRGHKLEQEDERIELRIYKVRWIWYHTILAVELFAVFLVLLGIYIKL